RERGRCNGGAEVIAASRVVLHVRARARDRRFNAPPYVLCRGHLPSLVDAPRTLAILWKVLPPGSDSATERRSGADMITITDKGAEKVHEFLNGQQAAEAGIAGLRVGVRGGGCSGFQYQLAFDEQRAGDVVFESHGLRLLV